MQTTPEKTALVARLFPHVSKLLAAKVSAEMLREQVDTIAAEILAVNPMHDQETGKPVGVSRHYFNVSDIDLAAFYKAEQEAVRARIPGAAELPPGQCPALCAEFDVTKAQWALVDAAEPIFKISRAELLCHGLDAYERYIDLLCGLCLAGKRELLSTANP